MGHFRTQKIRSTGEKGLHRSTEWFVLEYHRMISFALEDQTIFSYYWSPGLFGLTMSLIGKSFCIWVIDLVTLNKICTIV